MLYDLIRIAAQEIRIVYELFDFYTNYDTNLIRIFIRTVYTNCLYDCVTILFTNCLYEFDTNCIRITYKLYTNFKGDELIRMRLIAYGINIV